MLTLTDNATNEIRNLLADPTTPDGCGVRISTDPAADRLSLTVAALPAEDDQVLDDAGARVFVDSGVAPLLDHKALDASVINGGLQFSLVEQD